MPLRTKFDKSATSSDEETAIPSFKTEKTQKSAIISSTSSYTTSTSFDFDQQPTNNVSNTDSKVTNRFDKYKQELQRNIREEYETRHDRDAKAILTKKLKLDKSLTGKEDIYLGTNYYKTFLSKEDSVKCNATSQKYKAGPVRLSSTVRVSCRFDFRPDVCKDYKETGSCGFGDSCIYIHDRGDYKSGWQLEEEWSPSIPSHISETVLAHTQIDDKMQEEEIPKFCVICKKDFTLPVITNCSHVFCQECAMSHFKASKIDSCFSCKSKTFGLFKPYSVSRNQRKHNFPSPL